MWTETCLENGCQNERFLGKQMYGRKPVLNPSPLANYAALTKGRQLSFIFLKSKIVPQGKIPQTSIVKIFWHPEALLKCCEWKELNLTDIKSTQWSLSIHTRKLVKTGLAWSSGMSFKII